ncbi:MAG: CBS domain-containing protein [Armatimonas sp.]
MTLSELPLREVPVVEPSTSLEEAIDLLRSEPLHIVVLVGDGMYMGVLTDAALEPGLIPPGIDRSTLAVGPYVHPSRVVAHSNWTVEEAQEVARRRQVEVFPVVSGNIYKGILTREDITSPQPLS